MPSLSFIQLVQITFFSLFTALFATLLVTPFAIIFAAYLAKTKSCTSTVLESIILLPLVLPPVAIGLILLTLLSPRYPLGAYLNTWGVEILLTWKANVLAQAVVAFPLYVRSVKQGFCSIPLELHEAAKIFGKSPWLKFRNIDLPHAFPYIIYGSILAFTRALGEFGATILIAGMIPNRTETLALGIYARMMNGQEHEAWWLCLVSLALASLFLLLSRWFEHSFLVKT